jgi:hypothetical protein
MQRPRVFGLIDEHQIVVIAENVPNLRNPAAHQVNLVLEMLPLGRVRRHPRARWPFTSFGSSLDQGDELHRHATSMLARCCQL